MSASVEGAVPKAVWNAAAIDAYLMRLAYAVQGQLGAYWSDICAAADRLSAGDAERRSIWDSILRASPQYVESVLISGDPVARPLRAIFPFFAIFPRDVREAHLRATVLAGPLRDIYVPRWADDAPPGGFVDNLVEHVLAALNTGTPTMRQNFTEFVVRGAEAKWLISADFCLHDETRPNDVFAFTVFPSDRDFVTMQTEIAAVFPKDAKRVRNITPQMIAFLRSPRRFHFAFVVNRDRQFIPDVATARQAIDTTISMYENMKDAADQQGTIERTRRLRQLANANSFNCNLFQDMILLAAFGGIVATLLQLEGRAELIAFMPDRDDMTTSYGAIAYPTFADNAHAFSQRRKVPAAKIALGIPGPRNDGRKGTYLDEVIRIPDYIASGVSGTDLSQLRPISLHQKAADLVGKAFIDSSNVAVIGVNASMTNMSANRLIISSSPPQES